MKKLLGRVAQNFYDGSMAYPQGSAKREVAEYMANNGITLDELAKRAGITRNTILSKNYSDQTIKKINKNLGLNCPFDGVTTSGNPMKCPMWILRLPLPRDVKNAIEQEHFVNPERAKYYAENAKTMEDIRRLRREIWGRGNGYGNTSSLSLLGEI